MQKIFRLTTEYIELNKLLKLMDVSQSGAEANHLIATGNVLVDGAVETRKRCKLRQGQQVCANSHCISLV